MRLNRAACDQSAGCCGRDESVERRRRGRRRQQWPASVVCPWLLLSVAGNPADRANRRRRNPAASRLLTPRLPIEFSEWIGLQVSCSSRDGDCCSTSRIRFGRVFATADYSGARGKNSASPLSIQPSAHDLPERSEAGRRNTVHACPLHSRQLLHTQIITSPEHIGEALRLQSERRPLLGPSKLAAGRVQCRERWYEHSRRNTEKLYRAGVPLISAWIPRSPSATFSTR